MTESTLGSNIWWKMARENIQGESVRTFQLIEKPTAVSQCCFNGFHVGPDPSLWRIIPAWKAQSKPDNYSALKNKAQWAEWAFGPKRKVSNIFHREEMQSLNIPQERSQDMQAFPWLTVNRVPRDWKLHVNVQWLRDESNPRMMALLSHGTQTRPQPR